MHAENITAIRDELSQAARGQGVEVSSRRLVESLCTPSDQILRTQLGDAVFDPFAERFAHARQLLDEAVSQLEQITCDYYGAGLGAGARRDLTSV